MTIRITVTTPDALLRDYERAAGRYPALVERAFRRQLQRIGKRTRDVLAREPGRSHRPVIWQTERQRRAYFASGGFGAGIPYRRSGRLSAGWKSQTLSLDKGARLIVYNDVGYSTFVQGDRVQRQHLATGWVQANPVLLKAQEDAEEQLEIIWQTLTDDFAGVR